MPFTINLHEPEKIHASSFNKTYLLVHLDLLDGLVERDDLLAVVHEEPVPRVDLRRLVEEHLLLLLQLEGPLVDRLLQLTVGHRRTGGGGRGRGTEGGNKSRLVYQGKQEMTFKLPCGG